MSSNKFFLLSQRSRLPFFHDYVVVLFALGVSSNSSGILHSFLLCLRTNFSMRLLVFTCFLTKDSIVITRLIKSWGVF